METPYTVCALVLAYVQDALKRAGREVGIATVAAGVLVIDDCCQGALIVAPDRIWRTTEVFPAEAAIDGRCFENPIAVDLLVRVERCVPVLDDAGRAPAIAAQEEAYAAILHDAALVWSVLSGRQILGDDPDDSGEPLWERGNISQVFVGAEGGCVGVETRVTFGVGLSGWCLPEITPDD